MHNTNKIIILVIYVISQCLFQTSYQGEGIEKFSRGYVIRTNNDGK